jgi:hypothetical protein
MRRIIGDAARAVAVYLAWVLGGAAVGALVGQLVWGQWFLGALAGCLLAWFALPTGIGEANRRLWRPFYRPPRRPGANEKKTNALLAYPHPSFMRTRFLASISTASTAAMRNFRESYKGEVRRILIPRTSVNKGMKRKGRGSCEEQTPTPKPPSLQTTSF